MKLKLTPTQRDRFTESVNRTNALSEQSQIAHRQFQLAQRSANDLFETICDAHKVDMSKIDRTKFQIVGDELVLTELGTKSDNIRKTLKAMANGKGKAAVKK